MGFRTVQTRRLGLKISLGNSGIGAIPNISKGFSTCGKLSCYCAPFCYMNFATKMYKSVERCCAHNTAILENIDCHTFLADMKEFISKRDVKLFRVNVCGDFISHNEIVAWDTLAKECPETKFLAFTKKPELLPPYGTLAANLKVFVSVFFNMPQSVQSDLFWLGYPIAYTDLETHNRYNFRGCSKPCEKCLACFNPNDNNGVFLPLHGKTAIKRVQKYYSKR